uniref:NAC domain-containing protein n=1 Tax=Oryza brachyantha TaxID=4533 RepID=J3KVA4_ORYBR
MADLDALLDIGLRFNPSPEEVVAIYLPSLITNQPLRDNAACIRPADVYGAEPKDLAAEFAPVAGSSNGDRFFYNRCRRIKGRFSRAAGGGTWVSHGRKRIIKNTQGVKIGESKNFRFKKDGKNTDWLMAEYHVCRQDAGDVEPVVCRMYVSPRAPQDSAARQESAAHPPPPPPPAPLPNQEPAVVTQQAVQKSPPPCAEKMGGAVSARPALHQSCATPPSPSRRTMALAPPLAPGKSAIAPPRQVAVITEQQEPLKRPAAAPVAEPPCAKKTRGSVSASPVAPSSLPPQPPSRRAVSPPIETYPKDP